MKRDVKFRFWDEDLKTYKYDYYLIDTIGDLHDEYGGSDRSEVIIEQYTGLEDKNGKEIYEGDIVRLDYEETKIRNKPDVCEGVFTEYQERHEGIFEITFNKNWAAFVLIIPDTNIVEESLGDAKYSVEVIGNIHENPELLEKDS